MLRWNDMVRLRPLLMVLLLLTGSAASADEKPVTLDELVKEYERFELPMPPAGSKFVIYEWGYDDDELTSGGPVRIQRGFAFLKKPKTKADPFAEIYQGAMTNGLPITFRIRVVTPEPESLRKLDRFSDSELIIAVHCQKLGHKKLAEFLFEHCKKQMKGSLVDAIRSTAHFYWLQQINNPQADLKSILKHIKEHARIHRDQMALSDWDMIRSLELSIVPRNSKPGSIDEIIDDFIFVHAFLGNSSGTSWSGQQPVQQILAKGFDAIPSLIEHLDDRRFSRSYWLIGHIAPQYVTVGEVCVRILESLSGESFPRESMGTDELKEVKERKPGFFNSPPIVKNAKRDAVNAWWKNAQAIGEKEFLLTHLFPKEMPDSQKEVYHVNSTVLSMLAARYPSELKSVYLKALDHEMPIDTSSILEAIVQAPLDKPRLDKRAKREILERGLTHREVRHRSSAEYALAKLNSEEYAKRLLRLIERTPIADENDPSKPFESHLTIMSYQVEDAAIWPALEKAIRRSPPKLRFELLSDLSIHNADGESFRRERIRTLAAFLDDATVRSPDDLTGDSPLEIRRCYDDIELRNFAAIRLEPVMHFQTRTV